MNKVELGLTRLRAALHGPRVPPLAQYLNLWSLADNILVGANLDFSSVYELEPEDVFLGGPARVELFAAHARSFLNSLPADATLQFVVQIRKGDEAAIDAHRAELSAQSPDALSRLITDKKCAFIRGKFIQRRRCLLYVTSHPRDGKVPATTVLPLFRRPWREVTGEYHAERLREHDALERTVSERLQSLGLRSRKLGRQELLDLVFSHLNPGRPSALPAGRLSPFLTLREQAAVTALREEFDHVQAGDSFFRGVSLIRLPEASRLDLTQRLLESLWPDCDLVLSVHSLDAEKAVSSLKLRNNITRTLAFSAWTKNYEAEQKHLELDELITELRASAQRLFKFSLSVVARAESAEALRDKTGALLGAFHDFASAEAAADDMNHFRLFLGAIPGHARLNDRQFYVQTNALASLLPVMGAWRGSPRRKMLLETPLGELVGVDPFDDELPAKHGLILGTTGSGKSFTTNYILSSFLAESPDNHVVLVDVGGSYRKLARAFGGRYLEVALSEEYGFNPFPARADVLSGGQLDGDAVAYLSLLIARMCLRQGEAASVADKAFLEAAIKAAYEEKEEVLLSDVRRQLAALAGERPRAKAYADALELWTEGMYGRLFDRPGRLAVDSRLVVFDLQELENHPDLQGVYFFVIRSIIWRKLIDRRLKKIIAVDEGWKFFDDEVGAALIEGLYRTARKFNGAVFSISQSPKDFLDTRAANAIITNSYVKYVLKLTKGHELLPQFDLNAHEVEAVKALQSKPREFSDVFVKFGTRSLVARVEPGPFDYWLCTTDARDRVAEDKVRAEHPGLSEAEVLLKLSEGK